jgi:hypothetical protein
LPDVADAYQQRHGADFQALPCEPGNPDHANHRLHQAGGLDVAGPRGRVLYLIGGFDLDTI